MGTRERRSRSNENDRLISQLFLASGADSQEVAIAAVGSFGRGELSPGSDLDIVILHNGSYSASKLAEIVNSILYPLWDQKIKVDHSVRTRQEVRAALDEDLKVAMGLLDIRLICGDGDLVADIQSMALDAWRDGADKYLPMLETTLEERYQRNGELAYLLEPDLKESRGGLRDITALRAMNLSGAVRLPMERISQAESLLSTVREALHIASGRDKDKLLFTEQDKVAALLNYGDADLLMSDVAQSARAVDYLMQMAWHQYHHRERSGISRLFARKNSSEIAPGIKVVNKEVVIDPEFDIDSDPVIGLRAAANAAQLGLRLSFDALRIYADALDSGRGTLPEPWPREAREYLIALIGAGPAMVEIFEALDQEEIIFHWIPEWRAVRSLPQRNVLHRHTVDRHMVETAVAAAALTREVHRPDLLLFTSLFHDIGKGTEDDHSLRGEELIKPLASRIGFNGRDIATISLLIRHHLLLSATATRRDLDDPATIASVVESITDVGNLELLHALSIADGEATGRAAWSDWKASLVSELVRKTRLALTDNTVVPQPELTSEQIQRATAGKLDVTIDDRGNVYAIEIISPDKTGLLSIIAGVLNLLRLDVRSARTKTVDAVAVMEWIVVPDPNAPDLSREDLHREIVKGLDAQEKLAERIAARIEAYSLMPSIPVPPPVVETFPDAATDATVIEVRSHDRPALLFSIGDTVRKCNIDIKSAIVTTLGAEAIDTLYVTEVGGGALTAERAAEVTSRIDASLK
jgi:[protein-PII] uridylyltransferase